MPEAVDLHRRARRGGALDLGGVVVGRRGRVGGGDRRGRRGGGGVDGEGAARRGRVGVAGGVDGPDLEGVGAVGERAVGLRRAAGGPVGGAIGVEAALEARRVVGRGEGEARAGVVGGPRGAGVDLGLGGVGVDGEGGARRGRVGVAGGVDGPDLEGVGAVGERAVGLRRAAGGPVGGAIGVEAALEARRVVGRGEGEARAGVVGGPRGAGVDLGLGGVGVDGEGGARRGRVGVAGGVDGPDLEGVGAVGERAVGLRRAAGGPVGGAIGVEAALEARRVVGRGEGEARAGVVGGPRGAGVDLGLGGVGVDGEGARSPGSGRGCRRCRRPGPRRCGCRRRASCRPSASCRRPSRRRYWSRGGTGSSPSCRARRR